MLPDKLGISSKHLHIMGRNVDKNTGFSITKFLVLAILLIHASGCATFMEPTDRLMHTGRYSEAASAKVHEPKDLTSAKNEDIIDICYSCSKQKKYNELFPCLDQLEANIKKGETTVFYDPLVDWFLQGVRRRAGQFYPVDISQLPHLLRSEAYIELGNYDKAIEEARIAYDLRESMKWNRLDFVNRWPLRLKIRSLGDLALAYALKGDRENSMRYAKLTENESSGILYNAMIEKEKLMIATKVYMALGRYDRILELKAPILDALGDLGEGLMGDEVFAYVDLPRKFMLNKALYETGNVPEAKSGYDSLLKHPGTRQNGDIYWLLLFERGRIAESEGDLTEAIDFCKKAIEIIESQRSTINTEANKIGFVGDKQKVYHHIISALFADSQYAAAFDYAERAKSRALVDLLAENRKLVPKNSQINSMLTELDRLDMGTKVQGSGASTEDINQRNERSIEIKEKVSAVAPELYSLVSVSVPSPSEIQSLVAPDETIIEYYYFGEDLYVFIITDNGIKAQRLGGTNLVGEVEDLRKALETPDSRSYSELSGKLYDRLIRPIEHIVHTKNLVIVPHGILHYLPFSALYNGKEYLIDRYCVSYLPSSSVMKFLKERKIHGGEQMLVFGNPDLGDPRYDLIYAEKEALTISKIFPKSKVFLKSEATETAFKNVGGGFSYIHFACHGMFDAGSPLNSGIYLGKDSENDGHLTVGELYSTRLDAELVTLSACETGMGTIKQGDDVVGLTRGFLYAGSNSIVASLWKVDDLATSKLMAEFYSRLGRTGKSEALREAQLTVKAQYRHPYYWAAFQITGKTE